MRRQRKRTRNAKARNQLERVGVIYAKAGYVPTAQRRIVNPGERKGSEKRGDALRAYADLMQREAA